MIQVIRCTGGRLSAGPVCLLAAILNLNFALKLVFLIIMLNANIIGRGKGNGYLVLVTLLSTTTSAEYSPPSLAALTSGPGPLAIAAKFSANYRPGPELLVGEVFVAFTQTHPFSVYTAPSKYESAILMQMQFCMVPS
jgi:hypothetical protein